MSCLCLDLPLFQFVYRDKKWDSSSSAHLELTNSSGLLANGTFTWKTSMCNITYITCEQDMQTLLVHVRNGESGTRTIKTVRETLGWCSEMHCDDAMSSYLISYNLIKQRDKCEE